MVVADLCEDPVPILQPQLPLEGIQPVRSPAAVPGESIQQKFEAFHRLNPWVLSQLEQMTAECAAKGWRQIGIGMLFELLRWRYGQATQGDTFRLNNSYRSRYVRLLIKQHPEWAHLYEVRALRAA
jgi:hypothetical protein